MPIVESTFSIQRGIRELASLAWAATLVPALLLAQNPPRSQPARPAAAMSHDYAYRYRLMGVYDEQTGDPIEGAEVSDVVNGNKALTTETGTVSLLFLPEGGSLVRIMKLGYARQTLTVPISPTDTVPLTILLSRVTQLSTVVVKDSAPAHLTPHMARFEEHRTLGFGTFITEDELRKNDNHTFANVLSSHLPGIQQIQARYSSTYLASTRKMCAGLAMTACHHSSCYVRVFTDNVLTYDEMMNVSTLPDFARLNTKDYAAVEFYPGGAMLPPGISPTNSDCGTLVLYSRER